MAVERLENGKNQMNLYFIRHGLAEGHHLVDEQADFKRQLTDEGRKKLHRSFQHCQKMFGHIKTIYSSPLLRSSETAQILWEYIPRSQLELLPELDLLETPEHLIEFIVSLDETQDYAFVGHEPHLGLTIMRLLKSNFPFELKKGGMVILQGKPLQGFTLKQLIAPKIFSAS